MTQKRNLSHGCIGALILGLTAISGGATAASSGDGVTRCTSISQGLSLCAQVGVAVYRCTTDEPCAQHADTRHRLDKSRFWFLRRLFI